MPSQSPLLAQEQALESYGVGSIKKIFGRQREPYGFLTIHHPEELRGDEAVFYLKDVLVANEEERRLLQGGMMVRFTFIRKPVDRMKAPCPFKAIQVRPQDPMKYSGTVAKSSGGTLVVFLEILFRQVRVQQMNHTVDPGDRCTVSITWKEMVRAIKEDRTPVGNLVAIERRYNSFFSSPNDSYSEDCCKRCQNDYWPNRNNCERKSLMTNKLALLPFNSDCASIWSDVQPQKSTTSTEDYWDADWYLRTIRMAEMVLSNGSSMYKHN
ncbi:uncharacterized protein LOC100902658 [Galendromus occidentalis]|uniref:Uncharacterized protein LOC100902658 n=1 Tax=Galendromus occidentalis TaxID=34638 RepID=A0AAJ6QW22_9ACAR|nr:uncharacterized protein LOC100902658 [Galendromus occidentalis]